MFFAISPPRASTSRTTIPLAEPPIEGLQGIKASISMLIVASKTLQPIRLAAREASTPACPAPITIISYSSIKLYVIFSPISQDGCVVIFRPILVGLILKRLVSGQQCVNHLKQSNGKVIALYLPA